MSNLIDTIIKTTAPGLYVQLNYESALRYKRSIANLIETDPVSAFSLIEELSSKEISISIFRLILHSIECSYNCESIINDIKNGNGRAFTLLLERRNVNKNLSS